jgi:glycerol-3-phosphate dehydrogenase (NAD(P)+)
VQGKPLKPITLLGAGSWGTALALYLSRRGQTVRLWSIEKAEISAMLADKANNRYLPGYPLPDTLHPMADLAEAVHDVEDIIVVVPSVGFRQTLTSLTAIAKHPLRVMCATKGLDTASGLLLSEVAQEVLSKDTPFAMLSGPSFAREVAAGLPTAVVIASTHPTFLADSIARFDSPLFRIDASDDIIGVEIGGVVKNVIAIATGVADGMELGTNTRSAIITRGLNEIIRLGTKLGGKLETFIGLSGLGDLILTCSDNQSRNHRLGLAIGKGQNVQEAEREIGQVVEGKRNAELVLALAQRHSVDMPVCQLVWQILQGKIASKDAVMRMMSGGR